MNKKIILSLSVIGIVAAVAVGGTIAYFSDTETSTGNTFTAGTLDLKVDSDCMYNDMECINGYWDNVVEGGNECSCVFDKKNLTASDLLFDFADVKPGDDGEDTISLHVYDNDAWACATLGPLVNHDNGCTEPEEEAGDTTCGNPGTKVSGELGDNLYFDIWADVCDVGGEIDPCDNKYQPGCDIPLTSGPANGDPLAGVTWPIADSQHGEPLTGDTTRCIGVAWNVPSNVGNIIQSDSLTGNVSFYAVQSRNNAGFVCGTCGNGVLEAGEQCETTADCQAGEGCSLCHCAVPVQWPED